MVNKLKKAEKLILGQLEKNARMPYSKFKKIIGKSQQQISYTVTNMQKKEYIQGFYTLIDYSRLDVLNFRVYFNVTYRDKEKFEKLTQFFVDFPQTSWVATCGGSYDLIVTFLAHNPSQFHKTLRIIMSRFPDQLNNYSVLTTTVIRIFGRKYFLNERKREADILLGGDRVPITLSRVDLNLLNYLATNAKMSALQLAEKLDITPKTVIEHIKKLEEEMVIKGYKPLVNANKFGFRTRLLLIQYHNISKEVEEKLLKYLGTHNDVVSIVKTLGEWDIEIHIEVSSVDEIRKVEMEIRYKFANLIKEIISIPIYKSYKRRYFPLFLLDEET